MSENKNIEGIGGWLILIAIGVIISPIQIIVKQVPPLFEVFTSGAWSILTNPTSESYNVIWKPLLLTELFYTFTFFIASVIVIFLFFSKKRLFPKVYIAMLVIPILFSLGTSLSLKLILPNLPVFDDTFVRELGQAITTAAIWVPYMLVSERVAQTFTR